MKPPFHLTPEPFHAVSRIERLIGRVEGLEQLKPQPHLRKSNRVRTIQGSLAIEGTRSVLLPLPIGETSRHLDLEW